ncbi:MAG: hypothetical protein ACP5VE_09265 [Chthonomonadales bacterium]
MSIATKPELTEALAMRFASDLFFRALLEVAEPVKASEAVRLVQRDDVDLRLARVILASFPQRFTLVERKWAPAIRMADPTRPTERNLSDVLDAAGVPLSVECLARELGAIYKRPAEIYEPILNRLLANSDLYFPVPGRRFGLAKWLLITTGPSDEDVRFDNYIKPSDLTPYEAASQGMDPEDVSSVVAFLDEVRAPVPNRILQYLAWRVNPRRFNPARFFTALLEDGRSVCLSDGMWIGPAAASALASFFPAIAEHEVDEFGEAAKAEAQQPLVISDADLAQLVDAVLKNPTTTRASRLLEDLFEVSPGDPTYEGDLQTVVRALQASDQVIWLGSDRFLPQGAIHEYIYTVPEILRFPTVHYTDQEGNEVDLLLEDEGLDGGLQREIMNPLAQDVLDEEPAYEPDPNPPATARCVLKFHHKEIGTLPLSMLAPGFFPVEPKILQVQVVLPNGHRVEAWVNNDTRLLYGLLDWYNTLPVDSGAVFYLERQAPDQYVITYGEETEPSMFISRNRVNDLLELGRNAEVEQLPTFDILRQIMEHYRKGIEYLTLLTEVNIARRTTRRMVASLLSEYHCFFQRGGAWVYDARKLSQGFDRSKRKYLKK